MGAPPGRGYAAVNLGGHLASISDQAEHDWVFGMFGAFGGVDRPLWIGLNDAASEGNFVWVNGEPVVYTNWLTGRPDGAFVTEDYVHMQPSLLVARRLGDGKTAEITMATYFTESSK